MHPLFIDKLKYRFKERLQIKTGWGRNDVFAEFQNAIDDALTDIQDFESNNALPATAVVVDALFQEKVLQVLEKVHLIVRNPR